MDSVYSKAAPGGPRARIRLITLLILSSSNSGYIDQIFAQLSKQPPFCLLETDNCSRWIHESKLLEISPGQTIVANNNLQDRIYLVIEGQVRLLGEINGDVSTLGLRGSGQLLGWVSIMRGEPCEWVIASEKCLVLALSAQTFVHHLKNNSKFLDWFSNLSQIQESFFVAKKVFESYVTRPDDWLQTLNEQSNCASVVSLYPGSPFTAPKPANKDKRWYISTSNVPGYPVGAELKLGKSLPEVQGLKLPHRLVGISKIDNSDQIQSSVDKQLVVDKLGPISNLSAMQLGIVEENNIQDEDKYPLVRGKGLLNEALAVCEMIALNQQVPYKRDNLKRILEDQFRRNKTLTLELLAGLTEVMGLRTQLGLVANEYCTNIECPAVLLLNGDPVILFEINSKEALIAFPRDGFLRLPLSEFQAKLGEQLSFALPRRIGSTPNSRFGWGWFTPLLSKYKKSLILVFIASLLAQIFGLGIPLLIQQIIDKVLAQGNLSSLNVLGTVMIVLAVFQGCLTVLRTYIFVDTTDRMDLTLGSAVIDRLLIIAPELLRKATSW